MKERGGIPSLLLLDPDCCACVQAHGMTHSYWGKGRARTKMLNMVGA